MGIPEKQHYHLIITAFIFSAALLFMSLTGDAGDFAITVLTFLGIYSLLVDKQQNTFSVTFNLFSLTVITISLALLTFALIKLEPALIARSLPLLIFLIAWSIQAGNATSLRQQYWKPLLLLLLLAIPDRTLLMPLVYPLLALFGWDAMTFPTAHLATWLTTLTGLQAELSHLDIHMENAIVTVWQGCDGSRNMDFLLRLGVMVIVTLPVKSSRWLATIGVAVLLAFLINAVRVALLAHLANSGDFDLFDYWHEGDGSKLFNLSAIILFAVFAYFQISSKTNSVSKQAGQPES